MKKIGVLLAVALLLGTTSCEKEERLDPDNDGLLLLELRLPIDHAASTGVVVRAETSRDYPCLGYTIDTETQQTDDALGIQYGEIIAPDGPCAAALGPATSNSRFHNLSNGVHQLTIRYSGETVLGTLAVSDTHYTLELEANDIVRVVIGEVAR